MKQEKKHRSVGLIAGCAIILPVITVYGQQQDTTKTVALDEVTITATRSEKKLNSIGRSITVITANEIKNSGAGTISELLSKEEGIYISGEQQNPGSLVNIYTRGANSNHTIVMVDGIRISDPSSTDNSLNLSELSLADVDRIEIVRGSHSTLYGSSAVGGVINLITEKNNQTPGIHVDAGLRGAVFNKNGTELSENLSLYYNLKNGIYFKGEIFNMKSNGFNSTLDTITNQNAYKHADMGDGFEKTDIIGKFGFRNNKTEIFTGFKKVTQLSDIDDGAFRDDENYTLDFNRNLITYGASHSFSSKLSVRFNGGLSNMTRLSVDDSSLVDYSGNTDKSFFRGKYSAIHTENTVQLNFSDKGIQLVAGGNMEKESMSVKTYYMSNQWGFYESESDLDSLNINAATYNGFLHADLNGELFGEPFKPFSLGIGASLANHNAFGSVITYEINPSFKIKENTLIYLSYSTGFNAPSLYQLYSPEKDFSSGITRGNKSLEPEKSRTWEIGIKQIVNDNLRWTACYFNTVVENVVEYVYLWNSDQETDSLTFTDYLGDTYINLGRQSNTGFEFSIHSKISEKLKISCNISLVNGKLDYKPENIDTDHTRGNQVQLYSNGAFLSHETESIGLVRRPNTANLNFTYMPSEKLILRFDIKYAGARNDIRYDASLGPNGALGTVGVEDYTLLDLSARYEILKGFSAMIRVENILNTNYYEIRGYAARERGIYCGIRYSI